MAESDVQQLLQSVQRLFSLKRTVGRRFLGSASAASFPVLGILAKFGEQRLGDLAATLHVHPSVVTRQIADLESRGSIARRCDPEDRRSSFVALTDAGRDELQGYYAAAGQLLGDVLGEWSEDDVRTLAALVHRLATDVETKALATV